ncbi:hypothetical protein [Brevundimonas sp.]|uniref:hypothetical protein n=1 Tax=Brevundimonas sp. TaxID=1871086 RepID=UPI0025B8417A|nr:hypothetical protein [Brevundimonas sp.]
MLRFDDQCLVAGLQKRLTVEKGAPEASAMVPRQDVPKMTPGRAALVVLMQRYIGGLMNPFVSLLEAHKLLYFLQESGEGLRLQYRKAHYGPYAETQTTNATESGLNQSAKVTCPAAD